MFYHVVANDWGEITYIPTTLGNLCLIAAIFVLLLIALFFIKMHNAKQTAEYTAVASSKPKIKNRKVTVSQLVCCAASIALGTVLSNIKLFHFPTGGSITLLSMLVICLPGYWFGIGAGIMTGIAYGVLQMLIDPYILFPAQLVVDYLLAFGALGLSGLFCGKKNGLIYGYLAGILGRYLFAVISGCIFFGMYAWDGWSPLPYSLIYNGIYIFSEAAITIMILLFPPVKKSLRHVEQSLS